MKSIFEQVAGYRFKVEREGKEVVNVPGILAVPAAFIAPKLSLIGMVAAPLMGCSIHLESADGKAVDAGNMVKDAVETVVKTAATAAKSIKEEVEKAWESVSAEDPEECQKGEENADEPVKNTAEEIVEDLKKHEAEDVPVIHVENTNKPE